MPVIRKPPTGLDVKRLRTELTNLWAGAFARDQRMRDLVNQKNRVELLANTAQLNIDPVEFHSGRAGSIIQHAQSFVGTLPSISVEPKFLSSDSRRDAEQTERGFTSLFHQQLVANGFWHDLGGNLLKFGRGVLNALPLPSVWTTQAGYPVRKKGQRAQAWLDDINKWKHETGKVPFVINTVSADNVLLKLDSNDKVLVALETKALDAQTVAEKLGSGEVAELLKQGALKWYDQLPILQYIDDVHVAYFLTSTSAIRPGYDDHPRAYKRLKTWEHGLGKCPVVFVPAVKTDEKDYELRFRPFLADAEEDLELYDFLLSRLATMVKAYYFPSYEWQLGLDSDKFVGEERPEEEVNIGGVTVTYRDENLRPMQLPQNLPDAVVLNQELDGLIQRNTLEDVLFGHGVQGSTAGFALRLRINVAKNTLVPDVTHMAMALSEVFDLVTRSVEQLGETVVIDGEEITVEMAKNARGRIGISVDPKLPGEEGAQLGKAKMAADLGLPEDWYWENILGIADPATLRLLRDVQQMEELPEIKERVVRDALEELQIMVEEDETMDMLAALSQYGDQLDPEIIEAMQGLMGQGPPDEGGAGAPPPPPTQGPGRGPWPGGGSPQEVGGGRGLTTQNAPRPEEMEIEPAEVGTEEEL